jgi:SAM-dependent methyltransferase
MERMDVFKEYADLYDIFYRDKDYRAECKYVMALAREYSDRPIRSILDIGCGTGGHAFIWAEDGLDVTGLDCSPKMLAHAREKARELGLDVAFVEGDVRGFDLGRSFDAVTAMFAVVSYQTGTEDLISAFKSIRGHLEPGGLFIFDGWSGPGVKTDPPKDRVSYYEKNGVEIIRTVRADHDVDNHLVNVHYDILCLKGDRIVNRVRECHKMRYFFPQEVVEYAESAGFKFLESRPFMKRDDSLQPEDWNATFVLKVV